MQLFSTFEHNLYLEMAISTLEKRGIQRDHILAVPLKNRPEARTLFDTMHHSDGTSLVDIGMGLATAFSVVGVSVGFRLVWGPIVWGLISAFFGFVLGFIIRLVIEVVFKKRRHPLKGGKNTEVILIIECDDNKKELVEEILWEHYAMGMAKIKAGE